MAKVSSAPEDAYKPKAGFNEGWGTIIDAKALVFQYPPLKEARDDKAAGHQDPPNLVVALTIQQYENGTGTVSSSEPQEKLLTIAYPGRETSMLDQVHPGNYVDGDLTTEPEDAGGELGAEGNTLFALEEGYHINANYGWMLFAQSLTDKGFNPAILKRTYFPDLVGLYAKFETATLKKRNASQKNDPTAFVVTEIKKFPYEKGAAGKAAAGKATAKATPSAAAAKGKAAAAAAKPAAEPDTTAADTGSGDDDIADLAMGVLQTLATKKAGVTLTDIKKLKVEAFMAISAHKPAIPADKKKAVTDQLGQEDWLIAAGEAMSLFTVGDDGKVTFAA